jgi:sugar phosphate permease
VSISPVSAGLYAILWFINGVGQGLALPPILKLTRENSEPAKFATNWGLVLLSVNLASITNPFVAALIGQSYGWRQYVAFNGVQTMTIGALCHILLDTGADTTGDKGSKKSDSPKATGAVKWWDVLNSPFVWLVIIISFVEGVSRIGLMDWMPMYLDKELHFDTYRANVFVSLMGLGGIAGKLLAGKWSDALVRRAPVSTDRYRLVKARLPVSIGFFVVNAIGLHLLCFATSAQSTGIIVQITALLIGITISGNVVNISVMGTELGPKDMAGTYSAIITLASLGN